MTENLKDFTEFLSTLDEETVEKVTRMDKDQLIAYAAEKGFSLTEADFRRDEGDAALSMDELASTAGGGVCACVVGGGGTSDEARGLDSCACPIIGFGHVFGEGSQGENQRCFCAVGGGGAEHRIG